MLVVSELPSDLLGVARAHYGRLPSLSGVCAAGRAARADRHRLLNWATLLQELQRFNFQLTTP